MGRIAAGIDYGRRANTTVLSIFDDEHLHFARSWQRQSWTTILSEIGKHLSQYLVEELWDDASGIGDTFRSYFPFVRIRQAVIIGSGDTIQSDGTRTITHRSLFTPLVEDINMRNITFNPALRDLILPQLAGLGVSLTKVRRNVRIKATKGQDDAAFSLALANQARRSLRANRQRYLQHPQEGRGRSELPSRATGAHQGSAEG